MKRIGPAFPAELKAAGLDGLPFSWDEDGTLVFGSLDGPQMTDEQIAAVQAVYAAHDPDAPAPPVVPLKVTRFQARAALIDAGLLDAVNSFFSALPDGDLNKLAWQEAPTVQRDSDATLLAADALGITTEQMDTLFIRAGTF